MFPETQVEELLSWAHVQAVAWRAGVSISIPERDFGVDGTFRQLAILGSRRFPGGYALDFQLKASKQCLVEAKDIGYDLEVKTYNDLVTRNAGKYTIPCLLLLKVIPTDSSLWTDSSEVGQLGEVAIGHIYEVNPVPTRTRCEYAFQETSNLPQIASNICSKHCHREDGQ